MSAIDPFEEAPATPPGTVSDGPLAPPAPANPYYVPVQPAPAIPQPARRAPVNYQPSEAGWWLATDGLWYPPESMPTPAPQPATPAPAPAPQPLVSNPSGHAQTVIVQVAQPSPPPAPSWPQQPATFVTGSPKSKMAAAMLAIFLGGLGIHRFYLGNTGIGMVMLLLSVLSFGFLAPIVAIWAFIEGIVILTGGMKDAQGRALV